MLWGCFDTGLQIFGPSKFFFHALWLCDGKPFWEHKNDVLGGHPQRLGSACTVQVRQVGHAQTTQTVSAACVTRLEAFTCLFGSWGPHFHPKSVLREVKPNFVVTQ